MKDERLKDFLNLSRSANEMKMRQFENDINLMPIQCLKSDCLKSSLLFVNRYLLFVNRCPLIVVR